MRLFTHTLFLNFQIKLCFVIHTTEIVQPVVMAEKLLPSWKYRFLPSDDLSLGVITSEVVKLQLPSTGPIYFMFPVTNQIFRKCLNQDTYVDSWWITAPTVTTNQTCSLLSLC